MSHPNEMLEVERRCFVETNNPMHVWSAYSLARVCDAPVPEWVLRYFDFVSRNLLSLSADVQSEGGKDLGPRIAQAMKLEGKPRSGSPLVQYHADWMVLALNVIGHLPHAGGKEYLAIEEVAASSGVSISTVRRAFKLYCSLFPNEGDFPEERL